MRVESAEERIASQLVGEYSRDWLWNFAVYEFDGDSPPEPLELASKAAEHVTAWPHVDEGDPMLRALVHVGPLLIDGTVVRRLVQSVFAMWAYELRERLAAEW